MHSVSSPWTEDVQRQFIASAYEFYKSQHGDPCWAPPYRYYAPWRDPEPEPVKPSHQIRLDTLTYLYHLGRGGGQLKLSYKEFETAVLNGGLPRVCERHHRYRRYCSCLRDDYSHWYPRNGAHYRQKIPVDYSAKERDPEVEAEKQKKKDWRDKKGFTRSRRRDYGNWRRGVGARKYCRTLGNRGMRRWEERMIAKGDWDAFADQKSLLRLWLDPWDYD